MNIERIDSLISNDVESKYELCTGNRCADADIRRPDLETQLMITHSVLITELEKQIYDSQSMHAVVVNDFIRESLCQ